LKNKIQILTILVSSLFGYLEWGGENHAFLYEMEIEILVKLFTNPLSIIHPFILLPLFGQFLLIYGLFSPKPKRWILYLGLLCISILLLFVFLIGCLALNLKIIFSILPFILVSTFFLIASRKTQL